MMSDRISISFSLVAAIASVLIALGAVLWVSPYTKEGILALGITVSAFVSVIAAIAKKLESRNAYRKELRALKDLKSDAGSLKSLRRFILLSHSNRDSERASQLARTLMKSGFEVWLDSANIGPSDNWFDAMRDAVEKADIFCPVLSSNALNRSGFAIAEMSAAINIFEEKSRNGRTKPVIVPIMIDRTIIPGELVGLSYIDAVDSADFSVVARKLAMIGQRSSDSDTEQNDEAAT